MVMSATRPSGRSGRSAAGALRRAAAAAALLGLAAAGCARGLEGPLAAVAKTLGPGERIVAMRDLDAVAARSVAAVVLAPGAKSELRIYQIDERGGAGIVLRVGQGDVFRNLALEDVDGDGRDELIATWRGGHLEMIEVIARGPDGGYRSIFQNAGREIERRVGPSGVAEFWITGRTWEEPPGQPPAYETNVYRYRDGGFVEVAPPAPRR
jgi:hypothetical protein